MKIVAILSTTVLPLDGVYSVKRIEAQEMKGIPHYIWHPSTKEIVEALGAIQAESKLFTGLQVGESAIACSIKQGMSSRATEGHTNPHQEITADMLDYRLITRIYDESEDICCMCKKPHGYGWFCTNCGG